MLTHFTSICCASLALAFAGSDAKSNGKMDLLTVERNIAQKTNAERTRHGLEPLKIDKSLMQSARSHALWMTNQQSLQHTTQPVGENIAMGQGTSAEAVRDWMNSSGHRANILNPNYTRIGAAAYIASDGTCYWCQQFLE